MKYRILFDNAEDSYIPQYKRGWWSMWKTYRQSKWWYAVDLYEDVEFNTFNDARNYLNEKKEKDKHKALLISKKRFQVVSEL